LGGVILGIFLFNTHEWGREFNYRFVSQHHIVWKVCACVWLHFFFTLILTLPDFFFCIFWIDLWKSTSAIFSSLSTLSLSLSTLCLQLIFPPSFYIKHFPHFCLRISLICVGGCLVCVLIFFSIYYIFFFSLSSSLDLFFYLILTFDFIFQGGLDFFYTPSL
jgi:hypothetical protein